MEKAGVSLRRDTADCQGQGKVLASRLLSAHCERSGVLRFKVRLNCFRIRNNVIIIVHVTDCHNTYFSML